MDVRPIRRARGALDVAVDAPPSKSVTHRALVAAALASGETTLVGPLDADDTRITLRGLAALGVEVRVDRDRWWIRGCPATLPGGAKIELGESGTSARLLTAVAALGSRPSTLDGAERLRQRPLRELTQALIGLGADVRSTGAGTDLPLTAGGLRPRGGTVSVEASRSSQFASALLLVAPRLSRGLQLRLTPPVVSAPYVRLTAAVLCDFGVRVEHESELRWTVAAQDYAGREYAIEGDHSSASYFLASACVVGGRVRVRGLRAGSAQADARLGPLLAGLGCEVRGSRDRIDVRGSGNVPAFDVELADAPDLVPTVAVLGLFADGPCTIRGIAHLRLKESDRLELLAANLRALGRPAQAREDRLEIGPPPAALRGARLPTAGDHRMAMAFAVAGLRLDGVRVEQPDCVAKSFPRFWQSFAAIEAQG